MNPSTPPPRQQQPASQQQQTSTEQRRQQHNDTMLKRYHDVVTHQRLHTPPSTPHLHDPDYTPTTHISVHIPHESDYIGVPHDVEYEVEYGHGLKTPEKKAAKDEEDEEKNTKTDVQVKLDALEKLAWDQQRRLQTPSSEDIQRRGFMPRYTPGGKRHYGSEIEANRDHIVTYPGGMGARI